MVTKRKNINLRKILILRLLLRYETTGVRAEHLRDAMPSKQVQRKIQDFLCNGEPIWKIRSRGTGKARILVGHGLDHDLECLGIEYPAFMRRYDYMCHVEPLLAVDKFF